MGTSASPAPSRPNILCLVSDDGDAAPGGHAEPAARTPHLDRLAAEGIRYDRTYPTSPAGAAARFALATGVHAESCGAAAHGRAPGRLPPFLRGYPEYLRAAGYHCASHDETADGAPPGVAAHWRDRPAGAPFLAVFTTGRRTDAHVGARLAELDAAGLAGDTIVVCHSVTARGGRHPAMVVRVPRRWRHLAPGGPGTVVTAPVSLVDLPPTLLSLAGLPVPDHMQGTPFLGPARRTRTHAFAGRDTTAERHEVVRTVTDGQFRYVRTYASRHHRERGRDGSAEELYDLGADPGEVTNLAADRRRRADAVRLRLALYRHMLDIHDNGFIPPGSAAEGYLQSRRPGAYPIAEVIAVAELAVARRAASVGLFGRALGHRNEVVRYWAARGLLMLGPRAAPAGAALAARLAVEPSPPVAAAVAEALAGLGAALRA